MGKSDGSYINQLFTYPHNDSDNYIKDTIVECNSNVIYYSSVQFY